MNRIHDGLAGILITPDDWKKIHDLEDHARGKIDEARTNLWAIKRSLAEDVGRLVKVGAGIKIAVIAGALVGAVNTLVVMNQPAPRPWRNAEPDDQARGWRDHDDDRE